MGKSWESKGYVGEGNTAGLLDSLSGRPAIVAGSGKGVFEEVQRTTRIMREPVIFAVNDVGVLLPHIDHFVSHHTPRLVHWVNIRRDPTGGSYGNTDFNVHDSGLYGAADWCQWTGLTPKMSLSGLFAAQIAYLMGCVPIVLAGCPTDDTPRFWETEYKTCNVGYEKTQKTFQQELYFKPEFKRVLRSMSGWSKEFLGGINA